MAVQRETWRRRVTANNARIAHLCEGVVGWWKKASREGRSSQPLDFCRSLEGAQIEGELQGCSDLAEFYARLSQVRLFCTYWTQAQRM